MGGGFVNLGPTLSAAALLLLPVCCFWLVRRLRPGRLIARWLRNG